MGTRGTTWTLWTAEETARLDAIIRVRPLHHSEACSFPDRTPDAVRRQASKRRIKLGLPAFAPGRPREPVGPRKDSDVSEKFARSCDALHRATVRMCLRHGITLPGLSAAHTRAIAVNLGVAA